MFKYHIKQESLNYRVAEYTRLIEGGTAADQVPFNHKLSSLRDSTVSIMMGVYWILKSNPAIVRKAQTKCVIKDIDLGPDLLNDQFTIFGQLMEYFYKLPEFREEIIAKKSQNTVNEGEVIDDSEVLLEVISTDCLVQILPWRATVVRELI